MRALERQNILDISIQHCGTVDAAFAIAARHDIAITECIAPGTNFEHAEALNKTVVDRYASQNVVPATELSAADEELLLYGGIGLMGIEINFIIK